MSSQSGPQVDVHATDTQLKWWIFLNMWPSHFGLPLILATIFLSKNIQRHSTFISFICSWIITGIACSLLVYAGKTTGPEPGLNLCLFQAAVLYGFPPMASTSAFMLVLQMFLVVRNSLAGEKPSEKAHNWRLLIMLIAPYFLLVLFAIITIIIGAQNPSAVSRDRRFFYCSVKADTLTDAFAIITSLVLLATLILEGWMMYTLYRRWRMVKQQGGSERWPVETSLCIRIVAFGIYVTIALSLSLISLHSPTSPAPDLFIATASTAVFFIFGTQRDILRAWCFWRYFGKNCRLSIADSDSEYEKRRSPPFSPPLAKIVTWLGNRRS